MKNTKQIIAELNAIGHKYPKSKGGILGMFQHKNQSIAEKLVTLNVCEINDTSKLLETLYRICKECKESRTLLVNIYRCLNDSEAFSDVSTRTKTINENKAFAVKHDDGGGSSMQWNCRDYLYAITPLADSEKLTFVNSRSFLPQDGL